ncbi:hypothetical protein N658DRAFT_399760, partial [Parathielavia hyrcaniae]
VAECIGILQRNASFSDVRIITISNMALGSAHRSTRAWSFGLPLSVSEIVDGDRLQGLESHSTLVPTTYPDSSTMTDTAWQPLACLVQQLQFLSDFLYAGPGSFPPCLLEALLQYQPRCQLHVFNFRLRSLHLPETDPDELALATAPCLHSIWVWYQDGLDDDDQPDYHSEAVESMVKGLAPNLKEVHLFQEPSNHDWNGNPLPCPPWKGFTNV